MSIGDFDDNDKRPQWECVCCGKHLGKQGEGGDFHVAAGVLPEAAIHFGYGSIFDEGPGWNKGKWEEAPHVTGWICDECVIQRHERLFVRQHKTDADDQLWDERCTYTPLAEHPQTKGQIENFDFFGRHFVPAYKHKIGGARGHEAMTALGRADLEAQVFDERAKIDRVLVGRLLSALYHAEARIAKAEHKEREARGMVFNRQRQNAELINAEELQRLRKREGELLPEEATKLHESVAWYEKYWEQFSEAWGTHLHEVVEICDEVADGHPVLRESKTTVASVFEAYEKLDQPQEVKQFLRGCAKFFNRNFMTLMIRYSDYGYMRRWFEATKEQREELVERKEKEQRE